MRKLEIKNETGRSMIEMLGVLAIIGVLSVGGIAGYSKAMMKYRINKTIEQITLIIGNMRTFFANQRSYDGAVFPTGNDSYKIFQKAKIFPDEMTKFTDGRLTSAEHAFGGSVSIEPEDRATEGDKKAFYLQLYNIPENACIELLSFDWSTVNIGYIDASDLPDFSWKGSKLPIDVDKAVELCALGNGSEKVIEFYVDIDVNSPLWKDN